LQRLFYLARESANAIRGVTVRFAATMNGDTLKELGREVAMGGVDAPSGLPAACEEAVARGDGPTGIELWDIALIVDHRMGDSEIKLAPVNYKSSPKTKPQPNVLFEATVRLMLATPPPPKKPVKKKAKPKKPSKK
jgi:hypothetical protein